MVPVRTHLVRVSLHTSRKENRDEIATLSPPNDRLFPIRGLSPLSPFQDRHFSQPILGCAVLDRRFSSRCFPHRHRTQSAGKTLHPEMHAHTPPMAGPRSALACAVPGSLPALHSWDTCGRSHSHRRCLRHPFYGATLLKSCSEKLVHRRNTVPMTGGTHGYYSTCIPPSSAPGNHTSGNASRSRSHGLALQSGLSRAGPVSNVVPGSPRPGVGPLVPFPWPVLSRAIGASPSGGTDLSPLCLAWAGGNPPVLPF